MAAAAGIREQHVGLRLVFSATAGFAQGDRTAIVHHGRPSNASPELATVGLRQMRRLPSPTDDGVTNNTATAVAISTVIT